MLVLVALVVDREQVVLGEVCDLLATGAQTVLVLKQVQGDQTVERMIPFVGVYVDKVDLAQRQIWVDWQSDY